MQIKEKASRLQRTEVGVGWGEEIENLVPALCNHTAQLVCVHAKTNVRDR